MHLQISNIIDCALTVRLRIRLLAIHTPFYTNRGAPSLNNCVTVEDPSKSEKCFCPWHSSYCSDSMVVDWNWKGCLHSLGSVCVMI